MCAGLSKAGLLLLLLLPLASATTAAATTHQQAGSLGGAERAAALAAAQAQGLPSPLRPTKELYQEKSLNLTGAHGHTAPHAAQYGAHWR